MHRAIPLSRVIDLTDPARSRPYNMTAEEARAVVATGDAAAVGRIDGEFALVAQQGKTIYLARTIGRLLRYFIAKWTDGPILIVADRIDAIRGQLEALDLADQFHPSYTRMVPAHHVTRIELVGCPDPNPTYARFFVPTRNSQPADPAAIGERYVGAAFNEIVRWLDRVPSGEPLGVCFSGGIDSGAVFLLTYHALLRRGDSPARLKAFTLAVDGGGPDVEQARAFLARLGLELFLEPIPVPAAGVKIEDAIRVIEDYKPLDVQSAAMALALCHGVRVRYPEWKYLLDGDGGDENLKDYPIEDNPELTIRSVLNNLMLYQEGWGVGAIKHSLTYSGGQSRGYARTYAPLAATGFTGLSPFVCPPVIAVAEGIPFIELTGWDHDRLYALKGEVVAAGVKAVTGLDMPVFPKRRFQHGAANRPGELFPTHPAAYRRIYQRVYDAGAAAVG
ncbi:asparagine synthase C-terminal domain-containing protein [Limnoglobus roseus]|uniref:Asparagine synthetase B family protein n=1 Tax=Limnoglobus roseus TaxID=2598579 RepID=A0A5C1A340_9BACT|nr:asparagine synthase C-terminal domain-containing protein [Limnoglobus roseus]QEL13521.1 asparagine synthetase B family protein [Limnoglobus roseus]